MPGINIPSANFSIGDWNINISPSIAFGNASGIGASISAGYSDGNWSFSAGAGITAYSSYNGFGKNGFEVRKSILVSWDDGKTGVSLGTNIWSGTGGMEEFKQRTGVVSFRSGDFNFSYENDGSPFSYGGKMLSDGTDMYRTATVRVGIGEFSLQSNMFTGRSGNDIGQGRNNDENSDFVDLNRGKRGYWENPEANMYRLGTLSIGYKGYKVGTNSEWVRHGFQNWFAHTIISPQPRFDMLSTNWNSYFQYQTPNNYTSW